jgi:hypothetical protein
MPPHGLSTIRATNLVERGVARDAQDVVRARAVVVRVRRVSRDIDAADSTRRFVMIRDARGANARNGTERNGIDYT